MTDVEVPAHLAALPVRRGMVVPWIAVWTGERFGPQMEERREGLEPVGNVQYARREYGTWALSAPTNRTGQPLFGLTASRRQREAMERQLCQVCGRSPKESKVAHVWVVPDIEPHDWLWADGKVLNASTCEDCLRYAIRVCPFLLGGKVLAAFTGRSRVVAMTGSMRDPRTGAWETVIVGLGDIALPWMLGRELVVEVARPQPYALTNVA
jgi:hypothetical protein